MAQEKKRHDPFAPPYTPSLLLGEVKDEFEGHEYVILVRGRLARAVQVLSRLTSGRSSTSTRLSRTIFCS